MVEIVALPQLPGEGSAAHPSPGAQNFEARRHNDESEDLSEDDQNLSDMERDIRKVMKDSGKF